MMLVRVGQKLVSPLLVIVSLLLIVILQFGFIFLLIALLPSIAAYFIDENYDRANFRTIFASNLAATLPAITPIFISGLHFKHYDSGSVIGNPQVWLFIYGGAAAGWCVIYISQHIAHIILAVQYKMRVASLERTQTKILEEWGVQVRQLSEPKVAVEKN